jgi:hypothetical protein
LGIKEGSLAAFVLAWRVEIEGEDGRAIFYFDKQSGRRKIRD